MTIETLTAFVLAVMMKWPAAMIPQAPIEDVAHDIAIVTLEEGSVWAEDAAHSDEKGLKRTAVLLASLAYWEGARFAAYVDNQNCDEWMHEAFLHPLREKSLLSDMVIRRPNYGVLSAEAKHLLAYGTCDNGNAYSLWQIHPRVWSRGERREDFNPERLITRREAARAALLFARDSYANAGNLSGYSGEPKDACPKADLRARFAARFW